jgi:hypothetical protein
MPRHPVRRLFQWGSRSLVGHVVLYEAFVALPACLGLLWLNYFQGALTMEWLAWVVLVSAAGGVAVALPVWFLVTAARLGRKSKNLDAWTRR